jgi:hypothetical protein
MAFSVSSDYHSQSTGSITMHGSWFGAGPGAIFDALFEWGYAAFDNSTSPQSFPNATDGTWADTATVNKDRTMRWRARATNFGSTRTGANITGVLTYADPAVWTAGATLGTPGTNSVQVSGTVIPNTVESHGDVRIQYRILGSGTWLDGNIIATNLSGGSPQPVSGTLTGLAQGTTYEVRLQIARSTANLITANSNVAVFTTLAVPAAATNLQATPVGETQINLTWTDNATNEDGYRVYRCTGNACTPTAIVATLGANVTSWSDTGRAPGTFYRYLVRAFNGSGESADSNLVVGTTLLNAPSNLVAVSNAPTTVDLTWSDNSGGESGFKIERCTGANCSGFSQITTKGANVTSHQDTGLTASTTYRYRVRANTTDVNSAYSNEFQVTTLAANVAVAPPIMTATATMPVPVLPNAQVLAPIMTALARAMPPFQARTPLPPQAKGHGQLGLLDGQRTFADFIDQSGADRRPFLELAPGIEMPGDWSAFGGGVYQRTTSTVLDGMVRDIEGVETLVEPRALTRVESLALCSSIAGSFFYKPDEAAPVLYVHLPDGSDPTLTTVVAALPFYYGTKGVVHPALGSNKVTNGGFETWI